MRPDIAVDMARLGFAPRRILEHIASPVTKLYKNSSFDTEEDRMMAWVDRNT